MYKIQHLDHDVHRSGTEQLIHPFHKFLWNYNFLQRQIGNTKNIEKKTMNLMICLQIKNLK